MKAIAYSYWRSIKRGVRKFPAVPDDVKEDVRALAQADAANGIITAGEFETLLSGGQESPQPAG